MGDPVQAFYTRVRARAYVGGEKIPITGFQASYVLNSVPEVTVTVPIGRTGDDFSVSEAENLVSGLSPYTTLRVELEATPDPNTGSAPSGKDPGFPSGVVDVFDGFISEASYTRDRVAKSVSVTLRGFGKLGALGGATRFVDGLMIGGQHNGEEVLNSNIAKQSIGFVIFKTLMAKMESIPEAVWENGLKPLFSEIIEKAADVFSSSFGFRTGGGASFARQALEMIDAGNNRFDTDMTLRAEYNSLPGIEKSMVRQMAQHFYGWVSRGYGGDSSLLSFLFEAARAYQFVIVPCVKDAATVPLFFNLDAEPPASQVIDPDEYWTVESEPAPGGRSLFSPDFWAFVTTVVLTSPFDFSEERIDSPIVCRPVGVGTVNGRGPLMGYTGRLIAEPAPAWVLPYSPAPGGTVLPGIPEMGALKQGIPPVDSPGDALKRFWRSGLGDAVADTMLHSILFERRVRQVTGRLRLDLAPGSLVKLNTAGELFTGITNTFYGIVGAVSISVVEHGDHGVANTTLLLTHLRTEDEHKELTMPSHPLYTGEWLGGKLIDY